MLGTREDRILQTPYVLLWLRLCHVPLQPQGSQA